MVTESLVDVPGGYRPIVTVCSGRGAVTYVPLPLPHPGGKLGDGGYVAFDGREAWVADAIAANRPA